MSWLKSVGFAFGNKEDISPGKRMTFQDRKAERIKKYNLHEIYGALNIETIDRYQPGTRYLISKDAK